MLKVCTVILEASLDRYCEDSFKPMKANCNPDDMINLTTCKGGRFVDFQGRSQPKIKTAEVAVIAKSGQIVFLFAVMGKWSGETETGCKNIEVPRIRHKIDYSQSVNKLH